MAYILCLATLLSVLISGCLSFCPPLESPTTTYLKCEEPVRRQRLNCSSSWLPKGTSAYFKCLSSYSGSVVKGKIICFEDGMHRHVRKTKVDMYNLHLPCGITKNSGKPEIHIYGYEKPAHYKLGQSLQKSETDFRQLAEILHNDFRRKHDSPPLVLDEQLASLAQSWADKVAATGKLDMAPDLPYGQSIFNAQTSNPFIAVNDAINNWYHSGLSQYSWEDVTKNWYNPSALEFSQLIWTSSQIFGIGAASKGNSTVVIAFYDPPGNIVMDGNEEQSENSFRTNVPSLQRTST